MEEENLTIWSDEETLCFLNIWKRSDVQISLRQCTRKRPTWKKVSSEMLINGYRRSAEQCKSKMHNLMTSYRRVKRHIDPEYKCKFFSIIDEVLSIISYDEKLFKQNVTIETSEERPSSSGVTNNGVITASCVTSMREKDTSRLIEEEHAEMSIEDAQHNSPTVESDCGACDLRVRHTECTSHVTASSCSVQTAAAANSLINPVSLVNEIKCANLQSNTSVVAYLERMEVLLHELVDMQRTFIMSEARRRQEQAVREENWRVQDREFMLRLVQTMNNI